MPCLTNVFDLGTRLLDEFVLVPKIDALMKPVRLGFLKPPSIPVSASPQQELIERARLQQGQKFFILPAPAASANS